MIARSSWFAILAILALVMAGLQLDRQTRRNTSFAEGVPEIFRSAAQFPIAARALSGPEPAIALAEAEKLVRRRPLPAEHLRVLAQAQIAAGDYNQGTITIQYAAQRGWRDPLAQESMLRLALSAGDKAEAARRYAALFLRRDTQDTLLLEFGPLVLAEAGGDGRATLAEIVSGGARWHTQFMNRGSRVLPPDAFAEIIETTISNGTRYDCAMLQRAVEIAVLNDPSVSRSLIERAKTQCPGISG